MSKYKVGDKVRVLDKDTLLERQLKYIGIQYIVREIKINPYNYILYELDNQSIYSFYESELELVEPESDDILIGLKDSLDKIKSSRKILGDRIEKIVVDEAKPDKSKEPNIPPVVILLKNINDWSIKNGINLADYKDQMMKLTEEIGELSTELTRGTPEGIKLELGDVMITLLILHQQLGLKLQDTLFASFIKNTKRKGKMVKGIFIKEEDL